MMNIYVGNLPASATEDSLKDMFTEFGEVHSVKVIMDRDTGVSRGFGFVEMSENAARNAMTTLNGKEIEGKELIVNEARQKKRGYGGGGGGDRGGNRGGYGGGGGNRRSGGNY
ncbi:MAG: RNA-binding protein [Ignavibacteriae bacterium]|nr:RNA-binding protein [Ignavibacteriota bacterium]